MAGACTHHREKMLQPPSHRLNKQWPKGCIENGADFTNAAAPLIIQEFSRGLAWSKSHFLSVLFSSLRSHGVKKSRLCQIFLVLDETPLPLCIFMLMITCFPSVSCLFLSVTTEYQTELFVRDDEEGCFKNVLFEPLFTASITCSHPSVSLGDWYQDMSYFLLGDQLMSTSPLQNGVVFTDNLLTSSCRLYIVSRSL